MKKTLSFLISSTLAALMFSGVQAAQDDAPPPYAHLQDDFSVQKPHERIQQLEQQVTALQKAEGAAKQRIKELEQAGDHEDPLSFDKRTPWIDEGIEILGRLTSRNVRYKELSELCAKLDQHYAQWHEKSQTISARMKRLLPYHEDLSKRSATMQNHTKIVIPEALRTLQAQDIIDAEDRVRAGGTPPSEVKGPLEEVIGLIEEDLLASMNVCKELQGKYNPQWEEIRPQLEREHRQKLEQRAAKAQRVAAEEKDPVERGPEAPLATRGHEDYAQAREWFEKAAAQGNAAAQKNLESLLNW